MKYSIIIPAYNIENYINNLFSFFDVILAKRDDVEIIIVNDGSSDDTKMLITRYLANVEKKNIKSIHQSNKGVSSARNKGIELASGDYILFFDADDELHLDIFEILDLHLETSPEILCFNYSINGKVMNQFEENFNCAKETFLGLYFKRELRFTICSILFSRIYIQKNRFCFKEGFVWGEDIHFVLKSVLSLDSSVKYVNKVLFNYNLDLTKGAMGSVLSVQHAKSLYISDDIVESIYSIDCLKYDYLYYRQRGYIYMIKMAFLNKVESKEVINIIKGRKGILIEKVEIDTPYVFKCAKFILNKLDFFVFYCLSFRIVSK